MKNTLNLFHSKYIIGKKAEPFSLAISLNRIDYSQPMFEDEHANNPFYLMTNIWSCYLDHYGNIRFRGHDEVED